MSDVGYLRHGIGVYSLGLIAVILFIFLNGGGCSSIKELLIGSVLLISVYTVIMLLMFFAVPMLSI